MPLLKAALRVQVVVFNSAERPDPQGEKQGTGIIKSLQRHGIEAELKTENVKHSALGSTLLTLAKASSADLLVMGCYGHTRFREMLLGGVTRDVLASMTVPVFMSH